MEQDIDKLIYFLFFLFTARAEAAKMHPRYKDQETNKYVHYRLSAELGLENNLLEGSLLEIVIFFQRIFFQLIFFQIIFE